MTPEEERDIHALYRAMTNALENMGVEIERDRRRSKAMPAPEAGQGRGHPRGPLKTPRQMPLPKMRRARLMEGESMAPAKPPKPLKPQPGQRVCAEPECTTILSRYTKDELCWVHQPRVVTGRASNRRGETE